jgi:hypothetical protein
VLANENIKAAAHALLTFGLILTIRTVLRRASETVFESFLPGFLPMLERAVDAQPRISDEELAFLEAVKPGMSDRFLLQRAKNIQATIEPQKFFFFLGLLLANPEWDDLVFDADNDLFTHNLHLLPIALEKILTIAGELFTQANADSMSGALAMYFTAVGAVAEIKREKTPATFAPFVVLIDHFASMSKKIDYEHMKHAFPFTIIRSCYSDVAEADTRKTTVRMHRF